MTPKLPPQPAVPETAGLTVNSSAMLTAGQALLGPVVAVSSRQYLEAHVAASCSDQQLQMLLATGNEHAASKPSRDHAIFSFAGKWRTPSCKTAIHALLVSPEVPVNFVLEKF